MDKSTKKLNWLHWLQVLFLEVFFVFLFILIISRLTQVGGHPAFDVKFWISIGSLIMSGISLLGFIITTVINLRKEKREAKSFALDNEKKALEIQKLKLELQQAKEQSTNLIPNQKNKKSKPAK